MNLYDLMIALGLFAGVITLAVEPRPGRILGFALSAACFFIAALAAGGVIHT
ncbi:hypothetical protein ABZ215_25095 [Amycolatopsis sp. NPDC006131]|uniref:hypothetical protein n=1 Tax=Amycolatopsis sp. NPDC006131 TaxID=3156731 RepID=UPI0033A5EB1C